MAIDFKTCLRFLTLCSLFYWDWCTMHDLRELQEHYDRHIFSDRCGSWYSRCPLSRL